jgi:hypothetical protein
VCRAPPTTSESGKNASGQEAFGSKAKEMPVAESPVVSTTDVTSVAGGTGATAASEVDKAGTSTAPATEEEGGDLYMADPRPTLDPRWLGGGARVEDDAHRCLYVGTPWEAEVVADRRDDDEFKEASCTIERVLAIRVLVEPLCETWVPLGPHRPGSQPSPTSGSGLPEDPPTC